VTSARLKFTVKIYNEDTVVATLTVTTTTDRTITGTVYLPSTAASDLYVTVHATAYGFSTSQTVLISEGESSAAYTLTIPAAYTDYSYIVDYYVQCSYVQVGYYSTGGTTAYSDEATTVSVSSGSKSGIDLELIEGNEISGTISLPNGDTAPAGGIEVEIGAQRDPYEWWWWTQVEIPEGESSATYSLNVPVNQVGEPYYVSYQQTCCSSYTPLGYYRYNNGIITTVVDYCSASEVDVGEGDQANINLTLIVYYDYEATYSAAGYTAGTNTLVLTTDKVNADGTFNPGKLTYQDGNGHSRTLQGTYQADAGLDSAGDYKYTAGAGTAGTLTIILDDADAAAIEALADYDTNGTVTNGADTVEAAPAWASYNGEDAAPVTGKTVTVAVGDPVLITGTSPEPPSGMKRTYATNKGIRWGQYTYWPYDDYNNMFHEYVVAYDQSGAIIRQWDYNTIGDYSRYINNIIIDNSAKTFTFTTEQPTGGGSIVVNPYYLYSLYSTISVGCGQDIQTASGTFDVTFNLTLTNNQFASSGSGAITLGGVFAGQTCTFTRMDDTTATLRIQGDVSAGAGTFQIPAGRFVGNSQDSNTVSIIVVP